MEDVHLAKFYTQVMGNLAGNVTRFCSREDFKLTHKLVLKIVIEKHMQNYAKFAITGGYFFNIFKITAS